MLINGITLINFLENNFQVNYNSSNLIIEKIFLIEERHLCRLDNISFDAYGNTDGMDLLLKFNQICNPFSMELNDMIIVPSYESAQSFYRKDKSVINKTLRDTKALFIDPSRASSKDVQRLKQLEAMAIKRANGSNDIKPTNLLRNGESAFTTNGDALIIAPSISKVRQ